MKVVYLAAAAALALCACDRKGQEAPAASETVPAASMTEPAATDAPAEMIAEQPPVVGGSAGPHGPPTDPKN